MGVVWVKIGCSSTFSTFWVKPAMVDRISRAVVVGYGSGESEEVEDCVSEEKKGKSCEISLIVAFVVPNFVFFLFPGSARVCGMDTRVG